MTDSTKTMRLFYNLKLKYSYTYKDIIRLQKSKIDVDCNIFAIFIEAGTLTKIIKLVSFSMDNTFNNKLYVRSYLKLRFQLKLKLC